MSYWRGLESNFSIFLISVVVLQSQVRLSLLPLYSQTLTPFVCGKLPFSFLRLLVSLILRELIHVQHFSVVVISH